MMLMKNFKAEVKQIDDISILIFTDENGEDWYQSQEKFSATSLKFMFDERGNIVAACWDVSMLAPEGLSVSEIKKSSVPADFFEAGTRWVFDGKKIIPFEYSAAELQQQAESQREELLSKAKEKIVVSQTKLALGRTLSDDKLAEVNAWIDYIDALEACDTSVLPVSWPEVPGNVA